MKKEIRLDTNRLKRLGMVEAIWGEDKTIEQIESILKTLDKSGDLAFVTRISQEKASELLKLFKKAKYHKKAKCLTLGKPLSKNSFEKTVVLLSGGTSDLVVLEEAALALEFHGVKIEILMDVGVAGMHRLLDNLNKLREAKVVIAFAGMEGALPTVLGGLIPQPVIAVPVSVGYGVSQGGFAALQGMLASCAPGVSVMNIDNGYGAAMAALRIINLLR